MYFLSLHVDGHCSLAKSTENNQSKIIISSIYNIFNGHNSLLAYSVGSTIMDNHSIDLNIRAISSGAKYAICPDCIVYTKTRETFRDFKKQAYWNGYGRWQLKQKYKNKIDFKHKLTAKELFSPLYVIRNFYGLRGYIRGRVNRNKK